MSVADRQPAAPRPRFRWLPLTPVRFLLFLLVDYGFLALSMWFHWFPQGYAEWTAVAIAGAALILISLLFVVRLLVTVSWRRRLYTLLVVILACSITGTWWVVSAQRAKTRPLAIEAIERLGGSVGYWLSLADEDGPEQRFIGVSFDHGFVTDEDLRVLCDLPEIEGVCLNDTDVTDAGLCHLTRLPHLAHLSLRDCNITDAGLAQLGQLPMLENLDLSGTRVTDAGLQDLRRLKKLRGLHLANCRITDAGLDRLRELPALQCVYLSGTKVTSAGVDRLKERVRNAYTLSGDDRRFALELHYRVYRARRQAIKRSPDFASQSERTAAMCDEDKYSFRTGDLPTLLDALEDESPDIRYNAVQAFRQLGRRAGDAVPALRIALRDPDSQVRNAAAEAIKAIDGGSKEK